MRSLRSKQIGFVLSVALLFVCIVLFGSSLRTCLGMRHPEPVTGKNVAALREGNVVSVEYECAFEGGYSSYEYWFFRMITKEYVALRLAGKEEYVYATTAEESEKFFEKGYYFSELAEAKEFVPGETFIFVGKVEKLSTKSIGVLQKKVRKPKGEPFAVPNTEENTNFTYRIVHIEPEEELNRLWGRLTLLIIDGIVCFYLYKKYKDEREALAYLAKAEQRKRNKEFER